MQYDDDGDDVEQWLADELTKVGDHLNQLQSKLLSEYQRLKRTNYSRAVGMEYGIGKVKPGQLAKTSRCLNHATRVAKIMERVSISDSAGSRKAETVSGTTRTVGVVLSVIGALILIIGLFVMIATFWPGLATVIVGIVIFGIGILFFVGSKFWVAAIVSGIGLLILVVAFIILAIVLT